MQGTLAPKPSPRNSTLPQVSALDRHPKLTNSCPLWRDSFTGQERCAPSVEVPRGGSAAPRPLRPLARTSLRPAAADPHHWPQNRPPAPSGAALRPPQRRSGPCTPPSRRRPSQRRYARRSHDPLPTASAITAARPRLKDLPALPHRFENRSAANARMASSANRQGWEWTDNQGPTASHRHACRAVDGIHAVEDCARSNRGAPGCESRELSTAVCRSAVRSGHRIRQRKT